MISLFTVVHYLQFPRQVSMSTVITVAGPVSLLAGIPLQETDAVLRTAVIEVETNIGFPYFLTNVTMAERPLGLADVTVIDITPVPCDNSYDFSIVMKFISMQSFGTVVYATMAC